MERYNLCKPHQKQILDAMYNYFGFSDIVTKEKFIDFIFKNARIYTAFDQVINHTLKHIVLSFYNDYPEYAGKYIKYMWLETHDMLDHFKVGSSIEYDNNGALRHYIKKHFDTLYETKL